MKVKLLMLLGMTVVPLLSVGQTQTPVFYNKGKMSIVGTGTEEGKTVLYVKGSFIVDRDATVKSEIYVNKSRTIITGDFLQNGDYAAGNPENGFNIPDDLVGYNAIRSVFVFRGTTAQKIGTKYSLGDEGYSSLRKGTNFIKFPDIEIDNDKHVTIVPEIAASAKNINLITGRLILDSRRMAGTDVGAGGVHGAANSSLLAHLDVSKDGVIAYNKNLTQLGSLDKIGVIQVKVALDDPATATPSTGRSLVGLGSPFKEITADYFMYNHLMFPYNNNIFGELGYTESNPATKINAGKGFVVGVDLRGGVETSYDEFYPGYEGKRNFDDRAVGGYVFDRFEFNKNANNLYPIEGYATATNKFTKVTVASISEASSPYSLEQLNHKDIAGVVLRAGYNYLANPYTAPLNVEALTGAPGADLAAWNISAGVDLKDIVWVMNPSSKASGEVNFDTGTAVNAPNLYANWSYLTIRQTGGTYDDGAGSSNVIAPLQMFLVRATKSGTLTIPASARSISSGSHFLRSTTTQASDDFLFEVGDQKTLVYDRAAVVIRTPEEIMSNSSYSNVGKLISSVVDDANSKTNLKSVTEEGVVNSTVNSVIYTKDADGKALESNFLASASGLSEKTITLYLSPSKTAQDIAIRAMRLNTMDRVEKIELIDTKLNKRFILSDGKPYPTSVKPTDAHDRFNVRFVFGASGVGEEVETANTINSYYKDGVLTVSGFENVDLNSLISIYDIQGRMLKQTKVDNLTMNIPAALSTGAYIVKVVGDNKSYVSKFLAR